jgi:hypothetical protein
VHEEPVSHQEQVSQEPVSQEPVSQELVSQEPVSQEQVSQEPVSQEPVSGQQPSSSSAASDGTDDEDENFFDAAKRCRAADRRRAAATAAAERHQRLDEDAAFRAPTGAIRVPTHRGGAGGGGAARTMPRPTTSQADNHVDDDIDAERPVDDADFADDEGLEHADAGRSDGPSDAAGAPVGGQVLMQAEEQADPIVDAPTAKRRLDMDLEGDCGSNKRRRRASSEDVTGRNSTAELLPGVRNATQSGTWGMWGTPSSFGAEASTANYQFGDPLRPLAAVLPAVAQVPAVLHVDVASQEPAGPEARVPPAATDEEMLADGLVLAPPVPH